MTEKVVFLPVDVEHFEIIYEGLDAENGGIDMLLLSRSLEGFARILATGSSFAATLVYQNHMDTMPIRVRVQEFQPGSFRILAVLDWVRQSKILDDSGEKIKTVLKWLTEKLAHKPKNEALEQALNEMIRQNGRNQDEMWAMMNRMADGLLPAAKKATEPIGETCIKTTLALGQETITVYDENDKRAINDNVKTLIQPTQTFNVHVTELDIATGGARITFDQNGGKRIRAKISDPLVNQPDNPYAGALKSQTPILVTAKAEYLDDELIALHISDTPTLQ